MLIFFLSCSVSESELDNEFKRFLGRSFKDEFTIIKSEYSFAVGDDLSTLDVKFSHNGFINLLAVIPENKKRITQKGWQFEKIIPLQSGWDFFRISATDKDSIFHIQFGNE